MLLSTVSAIPVIVLALAAWHGVLSQSTNARCTVSSYEWVLAALEINLNKS